MADWDVRGSIKRKEVNSRSVTDIIVAENPPNEAESVVAVQEFHCPDQNPSPNLLQDASLQTTTNPPP